MSFRPRRALAVLWKDVVEVRKNRGLLWSMAALPTVIVVVPIGVVATYVFRPEDPNLDYPFGHYLPYPLSLLNIDAAAPFTVHLSVPRRSP